MTFRAAVEPSPLARTIEQPRGTVTMTLTTTVVSTATHRNGNYEIDVMNAD